MSIEFSGSAHLFHETTYEKGPGEINVLELRKPELDSAALGYKNELYKGPGGSLSNILFWLEMLGHKVEMHGTIGRDSLGQKLGKFYKEFPHAKIVSIPNQATGELLYSPDPQNAQINSLHFHYGAANYLDQTEELPEGDVTIFGGYEVQAMPPYHLSKLGSDYGGAAIINLGGLWEKSKLDLLLRHIAKYQKKIVVGNSEEALRFGELVPSKSDYYHIVTKGKLGAFVTHNDDIIALAEPSVQPRRVIDTMGAGDAFCAALISEWQKEQFSTIHINDLLHNAVDFATLTTTYYGSRPDEVIKTLQETQLMHI